MILRLEQQDDLSCRLYRAFEERVRAFTVKYDLTCPIDAVLYEMKQRWFLAPQLAGYFVDLKGDDQLVGHLVSWINSAYGKNRLYIYQAEMDPAQRGDLHLAMGAVQFWLDSLNEKLPAGQRVEKGEFTTWHSPEIWQRYLSKEGLKASKLRHVIEFDLAPPE